MNRRRVVPVACRGGVHEILVERRGGRDTFRVRSAGGPVDDVAEAVLAALGAEPCRCREVARAASELTGPPVTPEDAVEVAARIVALGSTPPGHGGCRSYAPGHHVHMIQARRSAEDEATVERATVVAAAGNLLTVRAGDGLRTFWHHDHTALRVLVGRPARLQSRWSIIRFDGGRPLSITGRPETAAPCVGPEAGR